MKYKIKLSFLLNCLISMGLVAVFLCAVFYNAFDGQIRREVQDKARIFEKSLNYSADNLDYVSSLGLTQRDLRLSIIQPDGQVVFDSYRAIDDLDNHLERPEVQDALEKGFGQAKRSSSTMGQMTYYYAAQLNDGTVLRLAETVSSVFSAFFNYIPVVLLILLGVFLLANLVTARLTSKIIQPINSINLEVDEIRCYDELSPFVKKINNQKQYIQSQMEVIEKRAATTQAIIKNMREGIVIMGIRGEVVSLNDSAMEIFSVNASAIGQNINVVTRNVHLLDYAEKAIGGVANDCNLTHKGREYHVFFSPVDKLGGIMFLLDITAQVESDRMRREFTANVSHELKTPLTTITGYSEMIGSGMVKPEDVTGFSEKIRSEATRLLRLIDDIIRLSQLDEITERQVDVFDMEKAIDQAVGNLLPAAAQRKVTIEKAVESLRVKVNRTMAEEIIYNLVDNGIKYNNEGGTVHISCQPQGSFAKITVSDSGIGIPGEHLERIFERFYRVDRSRSKKTGGTGLGLSIVKHAVAYNNGKIEMKSKESIGTQITVYLPLAEQ